MSNQSPYSQEMDLDLSLNDDEIISPKDMEIFKKKQKEMKKIGFLLFFKDIIQNPYTTYTTLVYCSSFIILGFLFSILRPLLHHLKEFLGVENDSEMALLFLLRGLGFIFGSIAIGTFLTKIQEKIVLICVILSGSSCLILIPITNIFYINCIIHFILGASYSAIDVIGIMVIMSIWKNNANPFLQMLYGMFGIGAIVTPTVVSYVLEKSHTISIALKISYFVFAIASLSGIPLLITAKSIKFQDGSNQIETSNESLIFNEKMNSMDSFDLELQSESDIDSFDLTPTTIKKNSKRNKHSKDDRLLVNPSLKSNKSFTLRDRFVNYFRNDLFTKRNFVHILVSLFLAIYIGAEIAFENLISIYIVEKKLGTQADATLASLIFLSGLTIGRFIGVFVSLFLSPTIILTVDILGCFITQVLLFIFNQHLIALYTISGLFGFFMSSILPSAIALPQISLDYELTGPMTSILVAGASIGEIVIPLIIEAFFGLFGSFSLFIGVSACIISCAILFTAIQIFFNPIFDKFKTILLSKITKR